MKTGIKIDLYNLDIYELKNKLSISSGTIRKIGFDKYNLREYKKNAFIPNSDWRPLTNSELNKMIIKPKYSFKKKIGTTIGLIKIPEHVKKYLLSIGFGKCKNDFDYNYIYQNKYDKVKNIPRVLAGFLYSHILKGYSFKDIELFCFSYEKPLIETIAYDLKDYKYFGLHIDDGLSNSIHKRGKNPNRLSINLGLEPRYLYFINLSATQIFNLVSKFYNLKQDFPNGIGTLSLVSLFFDYYPSYPVIRLKIFPFEAYFAPTDNIIHDGSTLDKTFPDITVVFIGYFGFPNLN